jgi:hypothetical protein
MIFKNPVRTSKRTPHFTITKINWLTLFKEIIAVYSENHAKPISTKCSITDCQCRWFIYLPLGLKGNKYVILYMQLFVLCLVPYCVTITFFDSSGPSSCEKMLFFSTVLFVVLYVNYVILTCNIKSDM